MKLSLTGIMLFVQDTSLLKVFYMDYFGMELLEETPSEWVLLQAGACQLALHRVGQQHLVTTGQAFKAESNAKLVFELETGITELRERLLDVDVQLGEIKTFDGFDYWLCDGEDPEGNVFQLKQKKK